MTTASDVHEALDVDDDWEELEPDDITIDPKSKRAREGWTYPYTAFPKQELASSYMVDEILFGGAAGPGKTDWMLAELVTLCLAIPNCKTLLLRNTYGELQEEIIPRLEERIPGWVGKYSNKLRAFVFYNGARLRLGYMERDQDKRHYIGAEYIAIGWDELTLLPWSAYTFLKSRLRATGTIAKTLRKLGLRPRMLATTNPGGPYHNQVKSHFVDPAPPGTIVVDEETMMSRVFVSATIDDNPAMPAHYRRVLMSLDEDKRKALLEGSWDVLEGVRFAQFRRAKHVIRPVDFPIPDLSGQRVICCDYGFAAPFAAVWMIRLGGGVVIVYREAYATDLTAVQQAELIRSMTPDDEWAQNPAIILDPAMWGRRDASAPKTNTDAPPVSSPAHDYQKTLGRSVQKANNSRVNGAARFDEKLRIHDDGYARIFWYDSCIDSIRTIPSLLRSKINPEDVGQNPKQEDHIYDATRYGLMYLESKNPMATGTDYRDQLAAAKRVTSGIETRKW